MNTWQVYNKAMETVFRNFEEITKAVGLNTLVAVSKYQSDQDIQLMSELGITDFGENQVQQLLIRQKRFPDLNWHFIGQLQTNKVKYLIGKTKLIHSLDSIKLAREIETQAAKMGETVDCLIQLKFDDDPKRGGVQLDKLTELYDFTLSCRYLRACGFMAIPPLSDNLTLAKLIFEEAKAFFDGFSRENPNWLYLSMGMSADYQLALDCGSNMVRIGEKLFTKS